jgi:23S rRNA (pseudouridine1915-N3)-methyltransferase
VRLAVLAVGRLRAGPEKLLAEDYGKRIAGLGRKLGLAGPGVVEVAESKAATAAARSAEESRALLAALPPGALAAVLDERGRALDSAGFAAFLRGHIDGGTSCLAFLIGGPDGHAETTRKRAGAILSLGPMTWPHRLVRVLLFEQIYRAVTIMVNHPYHRP